MNELKLKHMKNNIFHGIVFTLFVLTALFAAGCDKKDLPAETGNIEFVSLTVEQDTLPIMELTKVVADVIGENITYTWKCDNELGIFEGSGSEVMFTICHGGKFKITCEVKDNANHQVSRDVYVNYVE